MLSCHLPCATKSSWQRRGNTCGCSKAHPSLWNPGTSSMIWDFLPKHCEVALARCYSKLLMKFLGASRCCFPREKQGARSLCREEPGGARRWDVVEERDQRRESSGKGRNKPGPAEPRLGWELSQALESRSRCPEGSRGAEPPRSWVLACLEIWHSHRFLGNI